MKDENVMNERLPVSVVIVNYNAMGWLWQSVASVIDIVNEVIVVDNASNDQSMNELTQWAEKHNAMPRLMTQLLPKNVGFAAGCNAGFHVATQPFVLFLNPDCRLAPDAISLLINALDLELTPGRKVGMVGGRLLNLDGTEQAGGRRLIPTPWRSLVNMSGLSRLTRYFPSLFADFNLHKQPVPEKPIAVEAISGACMLMRSEQLRNMGGWDEGYFLHCEDLDLCMQYCLAGYDIGFVPTALAHHAKGISSAPVPYFVEKHKHQGMVRFYKKFFRDQHSWLLFVVICGAIHLRLALIRLKYVLG